MKIGIIGAGNIGGTLTRRLAALGHEVCVANSRGPETLRELAAETGATAASVTEAARDKDVVVTIPENNIPDLPDDLFADASDVVVVDTGNYYPQQRDGRIDTIEEGMVESRWVQQQLGRPVIKVFNNIYADHLRDNDRPAGRTVPRRHPPRPGRGVLWGGAGGRSGAHSGRRLLPAGRDRVARPRRRL
jgi:predicted dinucleotide-binding enzyme